MKIGNPADKPAPAAAPGSTATADAAKPAQGTAVRATAVATVDASATVALSSTATTLLANDSTSEFDAQKVGRISSSITSGKFKINPEVIADKLISNAQELLSKVPG